MDVQGFVSGFLPRNGAEEAAVNAISEMCASLFSGYYRVNSLFFVWTVFILPSEKNTRKWLDGTFTLID